MAPKLYMTRLSPPSRAVIMCAEAINLSLELVEVNLLKGDHLKPEYLKVNFLKCLFIYNIFKFNK